MTKAKFILQTMDILIKIFMAFIVVFVSYFVSEKINNYAYDYFMFPLISIITIFVCGINVGRSLEKLKTEEPIGFFTKKLLSNSKKISQTDITNTEFIIRDNGRLVTNKKILKETVEGDKVHIKVFNYNDIVEEESESIDG